MIKNGKFQWHSTTKNSISNWSTYLLFSVEREFQFVTIVSVLNVTMPFYTKWQAFILCANGNGFETRHLYGKTYCNRSTPSPRICQIHQRLRDSEKFDKNTHDSGRPRSVSTPEIEEQILIEVGTSPISSTRRIAARVDIKPC